MWGRRPVTRMRRGAGALGARSERREGISEAPPGRGGPPGSPRGRSGFAVIWHRPGLAERVPKAKQAMFLRCVLGKISMTWFRHGPCMWRDVVGTVIIHVFLGATTRSLWVELTGRR